MRLLLLLLLSTLCGLAQAEKFVTKVIAVLDGDTVLIHHSGRMLKVRLVDIDAPEKDQPFGTAAQRSLADMVLGKQVQFVSQAMDGYGRMIARLSADGVAVNAEQIRRGMAWEYSHYHSDRVLVALEAEARRVPRGLWSQDAPTPPWTWRKQHAHQATTQKAGDASCKAKTRCAQMSSCAEARHYLQDCGRRYLDADGDGQPCEALCSQSDKTQKNAH